MLLIKLDTNMGVVKMIGLGREWTRSLQYAMLHWGSCVGWMRKVNWGVKGWKLRKRVKPLLVEVSHLAWWVSPQQYDGCVLTCSHGVLLISS